MPVRLTAAYFSCSRLTHLAPSVLLACILLGEEKKNRESLMGPPQEIRRLIWLSLRKSNSYEPIRLKMGDPSRKLNSLPALPPLFFPSHINKFQSFFSLLPASPQNNGSPA